MRESQERLAGARRATDPAARAVVHAHGLPCCARVLVAVEAEFKAKTASGAFYDNRYHFLFAIEDGKVQRLKEYMDTRHAKVTFGL